MSRSVDMETLNVIQQVLRGLVVSLVAEHKGDMARTASLIQAFASSSASDEIAKTMLLDIASGLDMLGGAVNTKQ